MTCPQLVLHFLAPFVWASSFLVCGATTLESWNLEFCYESNILSQSQMGLLHLYCWNCLGLDHDLTLRYSFFFFFFKKTFIQHHNQTITFSNKQHGCKKKKSTLKPFVGMLYTFHRTETKITCYTISHKYSPRVFCPYT